MLGYTTLALAAKLQSEIDIDFGRKVVISSGEYLKGKAGDKGVLQLPAMSLLRTSAVIARSRMPRGTVGRYGLTLQKEGSISTIIRMIPVNVTYDITIITPDTESTEKVTTSLIWMYATPKNLLLPVKMSIEGTEQIFDVIISDESAFTNSVATVKQEEWDGGIMFTTTFDLLVHSYVLDTATRKLVTKIDLGFRDMSGQLIEGFEIPEVV